MKKNIFASVLAVLMAALLVGCGGAGDDDAWVHEDDVVLLEVDGEPVTKAMLEVVMESRGVTEEEPERMRELLDGLIRLQAVANAARTQGVSETAKLRAERRLADLRLQNLRFIEQFQENNPVTDADIRAAYNEQVQRAGGQRYRIEAVQFAQQAEALAVLQSIAAGEMDFDAVIAAAEASGRPVIRPDWIDSSQVPPAFAEALAATGAGEVMATPQAMGQAWLAARVVATEALDPPALDEVREGIRRTLSAQRGEALVEELFEAADVVPMLPLNSPTAPADAADEG